MKEIDFDELDKAVNSLMGKAPQSSPVKADGDTVLELKSSANQGQSNPQESVGGSVQADGANEPTKAEEPQLNRRSARVSQASPAVRRGKFMDVVRSPSRDTNRQAPSKSVSRSGAVVQPLANEAVSQTRTSRPGTGSNQPPVVADTETEQPEVSLVDDKENYDIATDPIDSMEFSEEISEPEVSSENDEDATPLTSPFLADAKVEKRPLGRSVSRSDFSRSSRNYKFATTIEAQVESREGDAQLPEEPIAPEFSEELLSVETNPVGDSQETTVSLTQVHAQSTGTVRQNTTTPPASSRFNVSSKTDSVKSEPSSIYDTASYHQPLAHPAKKKPGWLIVVAIIIIILLGAAGGALVYYLELI